MHPEILPTGHRGIWSQPAHLRTDRLVLVFHDAGSTPETVAEHYFKYLPADATGLALQAGFSAAFGHNWFTTADHAHPSFPEILSVAHRILDAIDDDEFGSTSYRRVHAIGVGQGAAVATTLLRVRPEAIDGVVGLNGYVLDNPMIAALDVPDPAKPVLWISIGDAEHPSAEFSRNWLTTHTALTQAKTTSAIKPFLT